MAKENILKGQKAIQEAERIKNNHQALIADLKERVINPSMRSYTEEAKQRIRDLVVFLKEKDCSFISLHIDNIKNEVKNDPDVQRKPVKWFADACKEFDSIVAGEEQKQKVNTGLKI